MSLRLDPDPRARSGPGVDIPTIDPDPSEIARSTSSLDHGPASHGIRVTAVLVAHDGAAFLPRTLAAIGAQSRRPDQLIAVDAGSLDGGGDLLAGSTRRLLRLDRGTSFGDAVRAALIALDAETLTAAAGIADPLFEADWLWLLHDDSAPAPDALERLLEVVDGGPSIGIAGCKQVSWDDDRLLLDVGFTTSRFGAQVTGIDVDDLDQGQLDHRSDVLAVRTAGMLVRRDVWDALGGPDPALAQAREDLDLCRRAHLAGLRVVVVPKAVIAHPTVGHESAPGQESAARRDRTAAVHLRLAAAPLLLLPLLAIWLAGAAVLRALARLALKQPQRATTELAAYGLAISRPIALLRAGARLRAQRRLPGRAFRRLLAGPGPALRQRRDALTSYLRSQELAWSARMPEQDAGSAATGARSDPPGAAGVLVAQRADHYDPDEEDQAGLDDERTPRRRRRPRRPEARIAVTVAALVGITGLVGLRLLLSGTGVPLGPALIPAPARSGGLWQLAMSGWRPTGLGLAAAADPFDAVLAVIAWPLGGSTRVAAELLLLAALPLSALLAWSASGAVTRSRALRAWAALAWTASPSLLGAIAAGRLAAIVAHLALPAAGLALARTIGARPGRRSLSAASWSGLLLTVVIAAAPLLAVPSLLVLLLAARFCRSGRRLLVWSGAVPAVLLLPWWIAVVQRPVLLLAEPGGPSGTDPGTTGWPMALWPADPASIDHGPLPRLARALVRFSTLGDPASWLRGVAIAVAVPLLALGLSALLRQATRRPALALFGVGLSGLLVAVLIPILTSVPGPTGTSGVNGGLHGWPGPAVSLLTLAVLAAALLRLDGAALRLRAHSVGFRHIGAVGVGVVAVLAPILVLAGWAAAGWSAGPADWVHRGPPDVVPAVAAADAQGPAATRTLVLKLTRHTVRWSLYRSGGPRTGQESAASLAADGAVADPVLALVGGLLADSGTDQRRRLADLDVGSVLLLDPVDQDASVALDISPGLQRIATVQHGVLWAVQLDGRAGAPTRPARVRVLSAAGALQSTLPSHGTQVRARLEPGHRGRTLVLAERADPGWKAWLDGTELMPIRHAGWAQAFRLPRAGGVVTVRYVTPWSGVIDAARLLVVVLALLVAIPLPRRRLRLLPPPRKFTEFPAGAVPPQRKSPPPPPVMEVEPVAPAVVLRPLQPPIWDVEQTAGALDIDQAEVVLDAGRAEIALDTDAAAVDLDTDPVAADTGPAGERKP